MANDNKMVGRQWMYGCLAIVLLALIAAPFLLRSETGVISSWWPVLLLLVCPVSMFFMMRHGHSDSAHRDDATGNRM